MMQIVIIITCVRQSYMYVIPDAKFPDILYIYCWLFTADVQDTNSSCICVRLSHMFLSGSGEDS